jgi:hypothetical protein
MFMFSIRVLVGQGFISDLLKQRFRMGWAVSEKFGCDSVDEVSNGVDVQGNVQS